MIPLAEQRANFTLLGCYAHARRYFKKAQDQGQEHAA